MSEKLNIPRSTINADIHVLRNAAATTIKTYIKDKLPFEHHALIIGIKEILKRSWDIVNNEESSEKAKGNALHVILQCYSFKRQLLIDVTYIQNEINAFLQHSKEELEREEMMRMYEQHKFRNGRVF